MHLTHFVVKKKKRAPPKTVNALLSAPSLFLVLRLALCFHSQELLTLEIHPQFRLWALMPVDYSACERPTIGGSCGTVISQVSKAREHRELCAFVALITSKHNVRMT